MEPSFTIAWPPFEGLRQGIDRLFDDFGLGFRWPFGRSLQSSFELSEAVDPEKKGVLTVTLPKKPEAQKPAKKIEVKAA